MTAIHINHPEQFEALFRKFKRMCDRAGISSNIKRLEFYEKPTWVRKRKKAAAKKRNFNKQRVCI